MSESVLKFPELKISVAIGAAIIVQFALALLWWGAAAQRIDFLERRSDATTEVIIRTARLEEQMSAIKGQLTRIEKKLDQRDER